MRSARCRIERVMRQPTIHAWSRVYDRLNVAEERLPEPLMVVVVEYLDDGRAIERARVLLPPQRVDAHPAYDDLEIAAKMHALRM